MKKLRSDSKWAALSREQREKLEGWLFDEGVSYRVALSRAKKQFGITASEPSLVHFYRRLAEERKTVVLTSAQNWFKHHPAPEDGAPEAVEEAAFKMLTIGAYEMALAGPQKAQLKELREVLKLLMQKRTQEIRAEELRLKDNVAISNQKRDILYIMKDLACHVKWLRGNGGMTDADIRYLDNFHKIAEGKPLPDGDLGLKSAEQAADDRTRERMKQLFPNAKSPWWEKKPADGEPPAAEAENAKDTEHPKDNTQG